MTINDVMTIAEAAAKWKISIYTLTSSCRGQKGYPPRFTEEESRQSGKTWLITKSGMERLYGSEKK